MATDTKTTSRSRTQDRAKVAGGQQHEVRYESKKTGAKPEDVRRAVESQGNSRKKVEQALGKKPS